MTTMNDWSTCTAIESIPVKVSGAWVFRGARVPVAATIGEFMEWFPGVTREQIETVLTHQIQSLEKGPGR